MLHKGWWKAWVVQPLVATAEAGHTEEEKRRNRVRFASRWDCNVLKPRGSIRGDLNGTRAGDHGYRGASFSQ